MDDATFTRKLPQTRIATLFVGINWTSFALFVSMALFGVFVGPGNGLLPIHIAMGLATSLIGMFGLVGAMFYLITTGAAVREAVEEHNLPMELYARTRQLKKDTFPWCMAAILVMLVTTVVGAGVQVDKIPGYIHMVLAVITLIVYLKAILQMKKDFYKNRLIMADVLDSID
ncbi:MAG: hypothetical protein ACE5EN_08305 [Nitrospinota bacterium]